MRLRHRKSCQILRIPLFLAVGLVAGCGLGSLGPEEARALGTYSLIRFDGVDAPGEIDRPGVCDWLISTFRADSIVSGELVLVDFHSMTVRQTYRGQNATSMDSVTFEVSYGGPIVTKECSHPFEYSRWRIEAGQLQFRRPGLFGEADPDWVRVEVSDAQYAAGTLIMIDERVYRKN